MRKQRLGQLPARYNFTLFAAFVDILSDDQDSSTLATTQVLGSSFHVSYSIGCIPSLLSEAAAVNELLASNCMLEILSVSEILPANCRSGSSSFGSPPSIVVPVPADNCGF